MRVYKVLVALALLAFVPAFFSQTAHAIDFCYYTHTYCPSSTQSPTAYYYRGLIVQKWPGTTTMSSYHYYVSVPRNTISLSPTNLCYLTHTYCPSKITQSPTAFSYIPSQSDVQSCLQSGETGLPLEPSPAMITTWCNHNLEGYATTSFFEITGQLDLVSPALPIPPEVP